MTEKAMFGAGCFWGVEAAFQQTPGVHKTSVGYSGGTTESPTYEDVCSGTTGHAEVVLVEFDPKEISYSDLLNVFWANHNPTQVNRQGPDFGTQYRTEIFVFDDTQDEQANTSKSQLEASSRFNAPIATHITRAGTFYLAEDYHQSYLQKRGLATCHI